MMPLSWRTLYFEGLICSKIFVSRCFFATRTKIPRVASPQTQLPYRQLPHFGGIKRKKISSSGEEKSSEFRFLCVKQKNRSLARNGVKSKFAISRDFFLFLKASAYTTLGVCVHCVTLFRVQSLTFRFLIILQLAFIFFGKKGAKYIYFASASWKKTFWFLRDICWAKKMYTYSFTIKISGLILPTN